MPAVTAWLDRITERMATVVNAASVSTSGNYMPVTTVSAVHTDRFWRHIAQTGPSGSSLSNACAGGGGLSAFVVLRVDESECTSQSRGNDLRRLIGELRILSRPPTVGE